MGRIVERCQIAELFNPLDDIVGDEHALIELGPALNYAVPDGGDLLHIADDSGIPLRQGAGDIEESLRMVVHTQLFFKFDTLEVGPLDLTAVKPDAVADPLGEDRLIVHINELIFQRGTSGIDYKNFHSFPLL